MPKTHIDTDGRALGDLISKYMILFANYMIILLYLFKITGQNFRVLAVIKKKNRTWVPDLWGPVLICFSAIDKIKPNIC